MLSIDVNTSMRFLYTCSMSLSLPSRSSLHAHMCSFECRCLYDETDPTGAVHTKTPL